MVLLAIQLFLICGHMQIFAKQPEMLHLWFLNGNEYELKKRWINKCKYYMQIDLYLHMYIRIYICIYMYIQVSCLQIIDRNKSYNNLRLALVLTVWLGFWYIYIYTYLRKANWHLDTADQFEHWIVFHKNTKWNSYWSTLPYTPHNLLLYVVVSLWRPVLCGWLWNDMLQTN